MTITKKITVISLFLLAGFFCRPLSAEPCSSKEPVKILFIGSSYFNYNDLPLLVKNLAETSGKEVYIDRQITNGMYLSDHAKSSSTRAKIRKQDWDYVVLQGAGTVTAYPDFFTGHPVYASLEKISEKVRKNCESTKLIFCMPWAFEDGMAWKEGWTDTYEDMQVKIYNNTLQYAEELNLMVAPVGWAWYSVLKEKNYPLHYLHMSDWNHPSERGSYLMACVIFSSIFKETSVGLNYYGGVPEHLAKYFQNVGSNTVLEDLELWNIVSNSTGFKKKLNDNDFILHQNYPNPFNQKTTIDFTVPVCSNVTITVFDMFGKICSTLINELKTPGDYSVVFNKNGLRSGTYFYKITIDDQIQTRKMKAIE